MNLHFSAKEGTRRERYTNVKEAACLSREHKAIVASNSLTFKQMAKRVEAKRL